MVGTEILVGVETLVSYHSGATAEAVEKKEEKKEEEKKKEERKEEDESDERKDR